MFATLLHSLSHIFTSGAPALVIHLQLCFRCGKLNDSSIEGGISNRSLRTKTISFCITFHTHVLSSSVTCSAWGNLKPKVFLSNNYEKIPAEVSLWRIMSPESLQLALPHTLQDALSDNRCLTLGNNKKSQGVELPFLPQSSQRIIILCEER